MSTKRSGKGFCLFLQNISDAMAKNKVRKCILLEILRSFTLLWQPWQQRQVYPEKLCVLSMVFISSVNGGISSLKQKQIWNFSKFFEIKVLVQLTLELRMLTCWTNPKRFCIGHSKWIASTVKWNYDVIRLAVRHYTFGHFDPKSKSNHLANSKLS